MLVHTEQTNNFQRENSHWRLFRAIDTQSARFQKLKQSEQKMPKLTKNNCYSINKIDFYCLSFPYANCNRLLLSASHYGEIDGLPGQCMLLEIGE